MNVSYSWLDEMVELPQHPEDLVAELVRTGTEVEAVHSSGAQLDKIVTAQIISKEPHPDSDHLWVTMVDVGAGEPLQIVCGAQNFEAGDHIVTAQVGAVLPGDFKIKKSKLRGVVSCGMNCSARELGLGQDHDGIMILPKGSPIGMPFAQYAGLSDTVLELEITPNRPDCLNMYGMAREVGAILNKPFKLSCPPEHEDFDAQAIVEAADKGEALHIGEQLSLSIADERRCMRYGARLLKNVQVGPSPDWLVKRLEACGCRTINNVVDITNYCLFLFGQPLHAFDCDKLAREEGDGRIHIEVRPAYEGEKLLTLDGQLRELSPDMTVVADSAGPQALAGVMGGAHSEVSEQTSSVLLESALFSSAHTSRTSRKLKLVSESSIRFERGVDPEMSGFVLDYAAALLVRLAGAQIVPGTAELYPVPYEAHYLSLDLARLNAFVGTEIPKEESLGFLEALGCGCEEQEDGRYKVCVPSFRADLQREVDLYEEVLRLWGMQRVPSKIPAARGHWGGQTQEQQLIQRTGEVLRGLGINETITYSLVSAQDLERLNMPEEGKGQAVELLNPMSEEQAVLRRSLLPGLLRSLEYNQKHGVYDVQLYEEGTVFYGEQGKQQPQERQLLSAVLSGSYNKLAWNQLPVELGFFDAKGALETLARELCVPKLRFKLPKDQAAYPFMQPGRVAELYSGSRLLGVVGEIHPQSLRAFDIQGTVAAFELDLSALIGCATERRPYKDVPKLPAVELDYAVVVDEELSAESLAQMIQSAGGKFLESVELFDVYRDADKLGVNKKSMAYKLVYRAADHTLSSEEVEKSYKRMVEKLAKNVGAELRAEA